MIPKAMSVMRTIAPQKLGLFQEKIPEIKNNQCLIRLERWSVCGSDIKSGWDHKKNTRGYPICHELAGTIIETIPLFPCRPETLSPIEIFRF